MQCAQDQLITRIQTLSPKLPLPEFRRIIYGSSLRPQEGRRESRLKATIPAAQRSPQDKQAKQEKQENEPGTSKSNSVGGLFLSRDQVKVDILSLLPVMWAAHTNNSISILM